MLASDDEVSAHALLLSPLKDALAYAPWMDTLVAQAHQIGERLERDSVAIEDFAVVGGDETGCRVAPALDPDDLRNDIVAKALSEQNK